MKRTGVTKAPRIAAIGGIVTTGVLLFGGIALGQTGYTWTGTVDSDWTNAGNWNSGTVGATSGTYNARLNVSGGTLVYTSALGETIYQPTGTTTPTFGRGLVMSGNSSFEIQSGSFASNGTQSTIVALNAGTSTLTVSGGTFISSNLAVGWSAGSGTGVVNLTAGSMTAGLITLGGTGSESGAVNLDGGTLAVNGFTFGSGSGITRITLNGGTLQARQDNGAFAASSLDQLLIGNGGAVIDTNGFGIGIAEGMTPDGGSSGGLTKNGAGMLTLSGTNTYTGITTINAGTLVVTGSASLPGFNAPSRVAVASGGTLAIGNGFSDTDLGDLLTNGSFATGSAIGFNTTDGDRAFAGGLSGGITIAKLGANTLALGGPNTYTGATTVTGGYLRVSDSGGLGSTSGVSVQGDTAGGSVQLADGVTISGKTITINGYGPNVRGSLQAEANATAEWAGGVILGGTSSDSRVGAAAGGTLTISGPIQDGSITDFIVSGNDATSATPGRVIVSSTTNSYSGQTSIFRGILAIGADNALPTGTLLDVHAASGISDAGRFDLNGFSQEVSGLRRGSTSGPAEVTNSAGTVKTLTINNTANYTFDSPITGNLALTKAGAGIQILSGANTYTGDTTISGGTLLVNGSLAVTTVSVGSGATLGGSGMIGGPTTILGGGILSPGNSPGTLTVNNTLALADTSILAFEINPTDQTIGGGINDLVTGVTDLTLGGTLNLSGSGDFTTVTQGTTWRLFNYTGTLTLGTLSIGTAPALAAGLSFEVDTTTTDQVNISVVPEPAGILLVVTGVAAAAVVARRRHHGHHGRR